MDDELDGATMMSVGQSGTGWYAGTVRRSLTTVRDRTDDPVLRALLGDVLAGRRPVSELAKSPGFAKVAEAGLDAYRHFRDTASSQELAALAQEAQRQGVAAGILSLNQNISVEGM